MDSPRRHAYAARVTKPLLLVIVCALPTAAHASTTAADTPTTGTTAGSDTTASSDTTAASDSAVDTGTMPPVYEPCGCRSEQFGSGWSVLLAALAFGVRRRRRR